MEDRIYINIGEIYTQTIILLKSNTMSICSSICTHNVIEKCIFNISNIPPLFDFKTLQHYFIFVVQVKVFEVSQKSKKDPFLVHVKIRNLINFANFRQVKLPPLSEYSFHSDRYVGIKCFRKLFLTNLLYCQKSLFNGRCVNVRSNLMPIP